MTKPELEKSIFVLSEKTEQERTKIERLSKSHWLSDYALDIFKTMKESELRRRPLFFTSTQLDHRPKLVQLCQVIARTYKLSRCSFHLAIYYLDRIIDFYTIRPDKLKLVALTCVHIAAQIENVDALVPRYSEMNGLVRSCYTAFEFKVVERKLLTFFDFELMRPTTASFVEMFACSFLTREDYAAYCQSLDNYPVGETSHPRYNSFEQMLASLAQLLLRICDYTLKINRFSNDPPSLLAASCIGALRQVSGVPKRWTPYLTELTSYSEHMVEPYVDALTLYHYYQTTPEVEAQQEQHTGWDSSWPRSDSGFEENLSMPQVEVDSVEVETFNNITVQLQKQSVNLKRNCVNNNDQPQPKRLKVAQEQYQV